VIRILLAVWLAWQTASSPRRWSSASGARRDKQRHFDVAIANSKVTELEPNLPEGFVNLGQAYMESQDYGAAITPLKRAVQLAPDLAAAHQLLGYALLAQGYKAEAIPHLEKVQEQTALGIAQIGAGQLQQAVENLQAALAKHPNDPDLLYYLGRASGLLSKQSIDTLLATYPESARAHQAMAENYFVLDRCPRPRKNSAKLCGSVLILRNCTSNSAWCTQALRSGPKPRRSFAPSRRSNRATLKPRTGWVQHCCNKEKPVKPEQNWSDPTDCSRICQRPCIL
jgi:tetratricopeptide (TPR) repeat protein